MKCAVDSDVIISAMMSKKGAAYLLLSQKMEEFYVSNIQLMELELVCRRLKLNRQSLKRLMRNSFEVVELKDSGEEIKLKWRGYTYDVNDAHIIAGAVKAKAKFLLSYNLRHFKTEILRRKFDLVCLTPGRFLQYLRSQS